MSGSQVPDDKNNPFLSFGDRRPVVILLEDVDKIGGGWGDGDQVKEEFWQSVRSLLEDGVFTHKSGTKVNFTGLNGQKVPAPSS